MLHSNHTGVNLITSGKLNIFKMALYNMEVPDI